MSIIRDELENSRELLTDTVATDTELALKLDKTGGTISSDLTVSGNLYVNGTETVVNTATVEVADNIIVINDGEAGAGVTAGSAGIEIDRGTATNYEFKFDESDDAFKVGEIGALQKVATREDAPTDTGLGVWDAATSKFNTTLTPTITTLHTTGNITTDGAVDGRDIATDGSKLDLIEDSATADQTAVEIESLYEGIAGTEKFTTAEKSKLLSIEDSATADQVAVEVPFTPDGDITAVDVQAAVVEVRDDTDTKVANAIGTALAFSIALG